MRGTVFWLIFEVIAVGGCEPPEPDHAALKAHLAAAEAAGRFAPLAPEQLRTAKQLVAVLDRPLSRGVDVLSGTALKMAAEYVVRFAGEPEVELREHATLLVTAGGDFALTHENEGRAAGDAGAISGRRCARVGGAQYTGRRDGPMTRIEPRGDEAERCLSSSIEPLVSLLRLFADRLVVTIAGAGQLRGRATTRVAFDLAPSDHPLPPVLPRAWPVPRGPGDPPEKTGGIWGPRGALLAESSDPGVL